MQLRLLHLAALACTSFAHAQVSINNTTSGAWIDIASTGTPLSLTDDGEVPIQTSIGNALLPAGTVVVGSNGGVRFTGSSLYLGYTNAPLPSTGAFNAEQTLLVFWDDINTSSGNAGEIYWEEVAGTLVISWVNAAFFANSDTASFQIQVRASGNPAAQFVYQSVSSPRANGGGSATIGYQAGGVGTDAQWSYDVPGGVSDNTVLTIVSSGGGGGGGGGALGASYCQPSNPNSTGSGATISAYGSSISSDNQLSLRMSGLPQNQFGYFLCGRSQGFIPFVGGGQGHLCMALPFGRFSQQLGNSGASGFIEIAVDLTHMPLTPIVAVQTGETWRFQGWYRDQNPGSTSNLTDALAITFL